MLAVIRSRGSHAVGLDRSPPEMGLRDQSTDSGVDWIVADVAADKPIVLPPGIDSIIHLAGKAHALAEVAQDDAEYARVNTEGTRRMLAAAEQAGVRAFVLFSTVKAVADTSGAASLQPTDELWDAEPDTSYGRSKRRAEDLVLRGGCVTHPVVLRPCLVYGPDPKGNLQKMVDAVRRGRFPPLPEVGNKRSMVHIDDLIEAAILAAVHPAAAGGTYIVADNAPFSTRQLFDWICAATGRPVPRWIVPMPLLRMLAVVGDWIGRVRRRRFMFDSDALQKLSGNAWYSSAKIQRELGWRPMHSMRESIGEIVRSTNR